MLNLIILLCIICFIVIFSFINEIKLKIMALFSIGILVFCWIPIGIDYFIIKGFLRDTTIQWTKTEWSGFLGSYLGGGIGAIITLFGVWWQIKRDDKIKQRDKMIGVLKGILYSLNRNLETADKGSLCRQSFYILDYYYYRKTIVSKFYDNFIYTIFPEIIKENYKIIFELDFGKEIIDLDETIKTFNKNYKFLILKSKNKNRIIKKIEQQAIKLKNKGFSNMFNSLEETKTYFKSFYNIGNLKESFSEKQILELGKKLHESLEKLILNVERSMGEKYFENEEIFLTQCMLSEEVLLNESENIFQIIIKIENLKKKVEAEIKKLENQ